MRGRGRAGEQIDDIAGKIGAVRRHQRRMFFAGEISRNDVVAAVLAGEHQIGAGAVIVAANHQFGVGNADIIRVRRISGDDGRTAPIAAAGRRDTSHSNAPATPLSRAND